MQSLRSVFSTVTVAIKSSVNNLDINTTADLSSFWPKVFVKNQLKKVFRNQNVTEKQTVTEES